MSRSQNAVVIGAGLAGLAAAYRLQQAGWNVRVLERNGHPGGCVGTLRTQGYVIDTGPDLFSAGYKEFIALARDVGLGAQIVPSSKVVGLLRNGRIWDIDPGKPVQALFTSALSWSAKFKAASGIWKLRKEFARIDGFRLFDFADMDDDGTNAYDWGVRVFGKEFTDYLIDPLSRATVTTGAIKSSWLRALGTLAGGADPLLNLLGGLATLPNALAKELPISFNSNVTKVEPATESSGPKITFTDADETQQQWTADLCIVSTMYHDLESIYPAIKLVDNGFGATIEDVNFISVQLGFKARSRSQAHVIQIPGTENPDLIAIFQEHKKAPDRAPEGHSLLNLYTDTRSYASFANMRDDEIVSWALRTIGAWMPELNPDSLDVSRVGRWPKSGYLATPGSIRKTRDMIAQLPQLPGIVLSGNLFGASSTMEGAVISGNAAANRAIASRA